ncbi:hypothetical protein ACS0TY_021817 [Phlomoides rotata]
MNGTAARAAAGRGLVLGYGGCKPPFTAVQWQELEKQTMIYKYLMAGLPVPPDLVRPIPRRSDELSTRFTPHSALGCLSYYGKKFDPESGRCRRTDGKKWRCSKAVHSESKYCERHMYRSRNRSRKLVESQPTSQSLSSGISNMSTGCCSSSRSSQDMQLHSVSAEESSFWSNVTKLQMGPDSYGIDNTESRYSFWVNSLTSSEMNKFHLYANYSFGLNDVSFWVSGGLRLCFIIFGVKTRVI